MNDLAGNELRYVHTPATVPCLGRDSGQTHDSTGVGGQGRWASVRIHGADCWQT
jgi:hypothetical protein